MTRAQVALREREKISTTLHRQIDVLTDQVGVLRNHGQYASPKRMRKTAQVVAVLYQLWAEWDVEYRKLLAKGL